MLVPGRACLDMLAFEAAVCVATICITVSPLLVRTNSRLPMRRRGSSRLVVARTQVPMSTNFFVRARSKVVLGRQKQY